jgi:hypothetical protein
MTLPFTLKVRNTFCGWVSEERGLAVAEAAELPEGDGRDSTR